MTKGEIFTQHRINTCFPAKELDARPIPNAACSTQTALLHTNVFGIAECT